MQLDLTALRLTQAQLREQARYYEQTLSDPDSSPVYQQIIKDLVKVNKQIRNLENASA